MRYTWYILGKLSCKWCDKAEDLLRENGEEYIKTLYETSPTFFRLLMNKAELTTVPQIWYGDEYVGGFVDLEKWLRNRNAT